MSTEAVIVSGLNYGDEGKGGSVELICRQRGAQLVCRHNGAGQAAHHVLHSSGRVHCFSQFGSGTFAGARTFLSRFMVVDPITFEPEAAHLESLGVAYPETYVFVDGDALVATPYHKAMNHVREATRGNKNHGSCGMGVGETMSFAAKYPDDALRVADLQDVLQCARKLNRIQDYFVSEVGKLDLDPSYLANPASLSIPFEQLIGPNQPNSLPWKLKNFTKKVKVVGNDFLHQALNKGTVVFEGAQGVLLDQEYGFHPYVTYSNCTFGNITTLLEDRPTDLFRMGVVRSYMTRHGAGPFVTESESCEALSSDDHNKKGQWQGRFRSGHFDLLATKYAIDVVGGIDGLMMTHMDKIVDTTNVCEAYRNSAGVMQYGLKVQRLTTIALQTKLTESLEDVTPIYRRIEQKNYAKEVSEALGVRLYGISEGQKAHQKKIL